MKEEKENLLKKNMLKKRGSSSSKERNNLFALKKTEVKGGLTEKQPPLPKEFCKNTTHGKERHSVGEKEEGKTRAT